MSDWERLGPDRSQAPSGGENATSSEGQGISRLNMARHRRAIQRKAERESEGKVLLKADEAEGKEGESEELEVSEPGDEAEVEADAVAEKVAGGDEKEAKGDEKDGAEAKGGEKDGGEAKGGEK